MTKLTTAAITNSVIINTVGQSTTETTINDCIKKEACTHIHELTPGSRQSNQMINDSSEGYKTYNQDSNRALTTEEVKSIAMKICQLYVTYDSGYFYESDTYQLRLAKHKNGVDCRLPVFRIEESLVRSNEMQNLYIQPDFAKTKFLSFEVKQLNKKVVARIIGVLSEVLGLNSDQVVLRKVKDSFYVEVFFTKGIEHKFAQAIYLFIKDKLALHDFQISYHPKKSSRYLLPNDSSTNCFVDSDKFTRLESTSVLSVARIDTSTSDFMGIIENCLREICPNRFSDSGFLDEENVSWPLAITELIRTKTYDLDPIHWDYAVYYLVGVLNEQESKESLIKMWQEITNDLCERNEHSGFNDYFDRAVKIIEKNYDDKGYITKTLLFITKNEAEMILKNGKNKVERETLYAFILCMKLKGLKEDGYLEVAAAYLSEVFHLGRRHDIVSRIESMTNKTDGTPLFEVKRQGTKQTSRALYGYEIKECNKYKLLLPIQFEITENNDQHVVVTSLDSKLCYQTLATLFTKKEWVELTGDTKNRYKLGFIDTVKLKEEM